MKPKMLATFVFLLAGSRPHLMSVLKGGRKNANIRASSESHPDNPGLETLHGRLKDNADRRRS